MFEVDVDLQGFVSLIRWSVSFKGNLHLRILKVFSPTRAPSPVV